MALGLRRCDGILFEYRGVVYKDFDKEFDKDYAADFHVRAGVDEARVRYEEAKSSAKFVQEEADRLARLQASGVVPES